MSPAEGSPRVLVNAAGSTSGGGKTYVLAFLRELRDGGARGIDWEWIVEPEVAEHLGARWTASVSVVSRPPDPVAARLLWEQLSLVRYAARGGFDVLVSAANFGPLARHERTIVVAANALHFDEMTIKGNRRYRYALESALARASVRRARATVTATEAMASLVRAKTRRNPLVMPFGPGMVQARVPSRDGRLRFLHRTGWGPHKRLEDLLRAVKDLASTHAERFLVVSSCDPHTDFAYGFEESREHRALLDDPVIGSHVQLRSFPNHEGGEFVGDAVVMPSTMESFCFPLAEGIAVGVPIVAAESPFARELCGPSARYAPPADPAGLAAAMRQVLDGDPPPAPTAEQVARLSWRSHADRFSALCAHLARHDRVPSPDQLAHAIGSPPRLRA
jgi:glycosyltransferase involved in cell wall biosynthesis